MKCQRQQLQYLIPGSMKDMGMPEPQREGDVEEAGQILTILQANCSHLKMTQEINIWKIIQIEIPA